LAINDLDTAAELCESFAHKAWPRVLNAFARRLNPILPAIRAANYGGYYSVLDQAEIATDVMFTTRPQLLGVWPDLSRHAALNLSSEDVLGLLGPELHSSLQAQVVTDTNRRPERWRIRHRMAGNWVKVYDKASVLRVETTINNPREFRIQRWFTHDDGRRERRWCPMRTGVSDLWRNYQVGIAANHRYLDALAAAPLKGKGVAALDAVCRPRTNHGRRYARFSPLNPADLALFPAAMAGEHAIRGFPNTDITNRLYQRPASDPDQAHRRYERVSRLIVKLRRHGLVAKIPRARRYQVTHHGQRVITAAIALHDHTLPTHYNAAARTKPEPVSRVAQILSRSVRSPARSLAASGSYDGVLAAASTPESASICSALGARRTVSQKRGGRSNGRVTDRRVLDFHQPWRVKRGCCGARLSGRGSLRLHVHSTSLSSSQLGPTTSALAARTRSASSRSAVTTTTRRAHAQPRRRPRRPRRLPPGLGPRARGSRAGPAVPRSPLPALVR
jgi:hypothetical protein